MWNPSVRIEHISQLPLWVVHLALKLFSPVLKHCRILVHLNNIEMVRDYNHQGGMRPVNSKTPYVSPHMVTKSLDRMEKCCSKSAVMAAHKPKIMVSVPRSVAPGLWFSTVVLLSRARQPARQADTLNHDWPQCLLYSFSPVPIMMSVVQNSAIKP